MVKILQKDEAVLHRKASNVFLSDIGTPKIDKIINRMKKALDSQEDGVAIAAPQIGEPLRIFVVSKKALALVKDIEEDKLNNYEDLVFINPEIIRLSKEKSFVEEGCLSVRWLYGKVERSKKAKIKAFDEKGDPFVMGVSGLMAQIFQHECDHLEGHLFIEKAKDLEDLPPEKVEMERIRNKKLT
jgi:peptide deformylase